MVARRTRRLRSPLSSAQLQARQSELFPMTARLHRICPERNEWRFYALSVQPDLFGGAALVRQWGRIGTAGTQRLDLYRDIGAAGNALAAMIRYRLGRRYELIRP